MPHIRSTLALICLFLAACGDDRAVTRGAAIYAETCAICHGGDLRGGGGAGVEGLSKTPSDLTLLARDAGGAFPRDTVLMILENYASGQQPGRMMRPFSHLSSESDRRLKTENGRQKVPAAQADLLAYLEATQRP